MEPESTPSQPKGERVQITLAWVALGLATVLFAFIDAPYPLALQSPILVKAEVAEGIKTARSNQHEWPQNPSVPTYHPGPLQGREESPPWFRLVSVENDKTDSTIEYGVYDLQLREDEQPLRVRYDPKRPRVSEGRSSAR